MGNETGDRRDERRDVGDMGVTRETRYISNKKQKDYRYRCRHMSQYTAIKIPRVQVYVSGE
jgi:hypothetical protein